MDDQPELIREQMEQTRASLTEKLETLEHQVVDTVQGATTAVADTVETVKEAVQDTVETVKDTFDVRVQVERHPWAMVGASIALGYFGGRLLRASTSFQDSRMQPVSAPQERSPRPSQSNNGNLHQHHGDAPSSEAQPGWLTDLAARFQPEIAKLRGLAVGALLSMARDMITGSAPEELKPRLAEVMDSVTVKLGGEPVHGLCSTNGYHA
jgi:hypothetical protein